MSYCPICGETLIEVIDVDRDDVELVCPNDLRPDHRIPELPGVPWYVVAYRFEGGFGSRRLQATNAEEAVQRTRDECQGVPWYEGFTIEGVKAEEEE